MEAYVEMSPLCSQAEKGLLRTDHTLSPREKYAKHQVAVNEQLTHWLSLECLMVEAKVTGKVKHDCF